MASIQEGCERGRRMGKRPCLGMAPVWQKGEGPPPEARGRTGVFHPVHIVKTVFLGQPAGLMRVRGVQKMWRNPVAAIVLGG